MILKLLAAAGSLISGFFFEEHGFNEAAAARLVSEREADHVATIALYGNEIQNLRRTVEDQRQAAAAAANNNTMEQLTVLASDLPDPIAFMVRTARSTPQELKIQELANRIITEALNQDNLSQHEKDKLLFWAVRLGSTQQFVAHIKALIALGANKNFTDQESGHRPISLAIFFCQDMAVEALLEYQDLDVVTPVNGVSVYQLAENKFKLFDAAMVNRTNMDALLIAKAYQTKSENIFDLIAERIN